MAGRGAAGRADRGRRGRVGPVRAACAAGRHRAACVRGARRRGPRVRRRVRGGRERGARPGRARRAARTVVPHEPWPSGCRSGSCSSTTRCSRCSPGCSGTSTCALTLGEDAIDLFDSAETASSGSNAWALHGSRTASGPPLLAGDPHRMIELPGVYQQVRLACDEFDVLGLAFPGVPGVQHFGHTGRRRGGSPTRSRTTSRCSASGSPTTGCSALGPDGWAPVTRHIETIRVRGGADVDVDVVETERGSAGRSTGSASGSPPASRPTSGSPACCRCCGRGPPRTSSTPCAGGSTP